MADPNPLSLLDRPLGLTHGRCYTILTVTFRAIECVASWPVPKCLVTQALVCEQLAGVKILLAMLVNLEKHARQTYLRLFKCSSTCQGL